MKWDGSQGGSGAPSMDHGFRYMEGGLGGEHHPGCKEVSGVDTLPLPNNRYTYGHRNKTAPK